jgi:hypothetical protein
MDTIHHQQTNIAVKMDVEAFKLPSIILLLALTIWLVECVRRLNLRPNRLGRQAIRLFRQFLPELVVLTLFGGLIAWRLLSYKDQGLENDEAWHDVKREWPILTTADSLLCIQAVLRFVVVLSASFRHASAVVSPFEGESAAFFLLASLARMVLLAASPRDVYHLDGPLGGATYVAFESVGCLLLLPFGYRLARRGFRQVMALLPIVFGMVMVATRNRFSLAGPEYGHLDMLFSLVMLLEMWAGIAFLYRSSHAAQSQSDDVFSTFAHIMLPIQQSLPTYFLLVAFAPPFHAEPSLVGNGRPFELLQSTGLAQVAMLLLAAYLHFAPVSVDKVLYALSAPIPTSEIPPSDDCVICLGSCEECDLQKPCWRRLQCGHHFHEGCIFEWLRKEQRCPVCRRDVNEKPSSPWKGYQQTDGEQPIPSDNVQTQLDI